MSLEEIHSRARGPGEARTWCMIGLDVGGTKIAGGVVLFPGAEIFASNQVQTRIERGGQAVLDDALAMAEELAVEARRRARPVDGIGVGLCELVGPDGRILTGCTVDWRGLPVLERLSRHGFALIEADSRAAALAEAHFGAGRGLRSFFHVTVGTGIGSAFVLDGMPHLGATGSTGTLASSPLPWDKDAAVAPSLEAYAGGPALVRRYRQAGGMAESAADVILAAESGDPPARAVVISAAKAVGAVLALMVDVLDPEAVVFGGGLGLSDLYRGMVVASMRRSIWADTHRDLPVLPSTLGRDAGWVGAAAAAWFARRNSMAR
jgi:glucokinase